MLRTVILTLTVLLNIWICTCASAHESQPATLEIREVARDRLEVIWRAPTYYGRPHPTTLELPEKWQDAVPTTMHQLPDSQVFRRLITTDGKSVDGKVIRFAGLEYTITTVFVRLVRLDGTAMTSAVRPSKPLIKLRGERSWHQAAVEYGLLGLHHILQGIDHLLFVLGLLLIVKARLMLIKTITAFTIAHSITLGLATLGYASVPLAPLNAAIALSILFLGPEIVRSWRGETSLTIRYPWLVAFFFGLLHGFGFASGLTTVGMPRSEISLALLFFNVGVEAGQLLFIMIALAGLASLRRLELRLPRWAELVPMYAFGSVAAFWFVQRFTLLIS